MSRNVEQFRQVLGRSVRAIREEAGRLQEHVAQGARDYGLDWTRATVAAIETGRRQLVDTELILLPLVLGRAVERPVELNALFPDDVMVEINTKLRVSAKNIRKVVSGEASTIRNTGEVDAPFRRTARDEWVDDEKQITDLLPYWPALDGGGRDAIRHALASPVGEAETKAARRLGTTPTVVQVLAYRLWERSLTAERDHEVKKKATNAAPAALRVHRGHVTRSLVDELRTYLSDTELGGLRDGTR